MTVSAKSYAFTFIFPVRREKKTREVKFGFAHNNILIDKARQCGMHAKIECK